MNTIIVKVSVVACALSACAVAGWHVKQKDHVEKISLAEFLTATSFNGIRLKPVKSAIVSGRVRLTPLADYRTDGEKVHLEFKLGRLFKNWIGGTYKLWFGDHEVSGGWNVAPRNVVELDIREIDGSKPSENEPLLTFQPPRYVGNTFSMSGNMWSDEHSGSWGLFLLRNNPNLEKRGPSDDESSGIAIEP